MQVSPPTPHPWLCVAGLRSTATRLICLVCRLANPCGAQPTAPLRCVVLSISVVSRIACLFAVSVQCASSHTTHCTPTPALVEGVAWTGAACMLIAWYTSYEPIASHPVPRVPQRSLWWLSHSHTFSSLCSSPLTILDTQQTFTL
jgi:hypothetical protein